MQTVASTDPAKFLIMKTISYGLLIVMIFGGSTTRVQKTSLYIPERSSSLGFAETSQSYKSLTQFRIKFPCKQKALTIRLKGSFKIRKEYSIPTDFMRVKYFLLCIHPYKIHSKTKQKFI